MNKVALAFSKMALSIMEARKHFSNNFAANVPGVLILLIKCTRSFLN